MHIFWCALLNWQDLVKIMISATSSRAAAEPVPVGSIGDVVVAAVQFLDERMTGGENPAARFNDLLRWRGYSLWPRVCGFLAQIAHASCRSNLFTFGKRMQRYAYSRAWQSRVDGRLRG